MAVLTAGAAVAESERDSLHPTVSPTDRPRDADGVITPLQVICGNDCKAVRASLAKADLAEIEKLPAQVSDTILSLEGQPSLPANPMAKAFMAKLAGGTFDGNFDSVKTGRRICTVYWYGFMENGSEVVGTHQCRIGRQGGNLTIEKLTGTRMSGTLYPYTTAARVFVGRTIYEDRKDSFDNKVGMALTDKERLYLINIDEKGMEPPDSTFFEVIAIE